jgi:hypothetical protein
VDITVDMVDGLRCCAGGMGGAVRVVRVSYLQRARHGGHWSLVVASVGWEDQCGSCME